MSLQPVFGKRGLLLSLAAAISLSLCASFAAAGGERRSYVLISPNTRDALDDQDAEASLSSFEQSNAVAVADRLACSLTHRVQIGNSLGVYAGSSENGLILVSDLGASKTEYVASL